MTRTEQTAALPDHADPDREPLRSDARQNREHILAVARAALGASGDVSLNSIAKEAGVGPGTLYRHFPSREALLLAVYHDEVRALTDAAADLLAQHEPLQALRLWFDHLARCGLSNHTLSGALQSVIAGDPADGIYARITGAAARLLSACQQSGSVSRDIEPADLLLLVGLLWRIEPGPTAPARASRLLDVIMSGLHADGPRSLSRARSRPARSSLRLRRRLSLSSFRAPRSL